MAREAVGETYTSAGVSGSCQVKAARSPARSRAKPPSVPSFGVMTRGALPSAGRAMRAPCVCTGSATQMVFPSPDQPRIEAVRFGVSASLWGVPPEAGTTYTSARLTGSGFAPVEANATVFPSGE